MANLKLSICFGLSDRTKAIFDGVVRPRGIDLVAVPYSDIFDLFRRTLNYGEFDISELSLSNYILAREMGLNYVAIPVFPSRKFRHSNIFVNRKSRISSPKDLHGKKIGLHAYYSSAAIWQRGILQHEFGFHPEKATWFTQNEERLPFKVPKGVSITRIKDYDSAFEKGEIDATFGPRPPRSFPSSPEIRRLFQDPETVEKEYFRRTGIYPIMHVIVIRKSILKEHKWVAPNLLEAFTEAKKLWKKYSTSLTVGLTWFNSYVEDERRVLGEDSHPCNIKDNRKTLNALIQYCSEQAVMKKVPKIEELFAENTL